VAPTLPRKVRVIMILLPSHKSINGGSFVRTTEGLNSHDAEKPSAV